MTVPALPPSGSTDWYTHYSALDAEAREFNLAKADLAKVLVLGPEEALPDPLPDSNTIILRRFV